MSEIVVGPWFTTKFEAARDAHEDRLVDEMVDNQIKAAKEDRLVTGGEYECVGGCDGYLTFPCDLCVYRTPEQMAEFNKMLKGLMPLDNPADCVVQLAPEREESANG